MINPVFQEKLMSALHDAVGHFNGGMSPTDAVTKAANDYSFNTDQATRLGETFNTARTIYHFDKTANTDDKCATFELADNAKVILNLFNKKETKKEASLMDYSFYNQIPQDHTLTDIDISFSKAAEVDIEGLTLDNQGNRIRRIVSIYNSLAEEAFSKSASAEWEVDNMLGKVASVLKQGYINKGTDVVDRLFFIFKDAEYEPVLNKLAVKLPEYLEVDDSRRDSYGLVIEDRDLNELKAYVKRAKSLLMDVAELKAVGNSIEKDAKDLDDEFTSLFLTGCPEKEGETVSDFFTDEANNASLSKSAQTASKDPTREEVIRAMSPDERAEHAEVQKLLSMEAQNKPKATDSLELKLKQKQLKARDPNAKGWSEYIMPAPEMPIKGFGTMVDAFSKDYLASGLERTLRDPIVNLNKQITQRIKNLQHTEHLNDLMVNDPVISDADPRDVTNAFRTLLETAPELFSRKEVLRSGLRMFLQSGGGVSSFDIAQMLAGEKTQRELGGSMPERRKV